MRSTRDSTLVLGAPWPHRLEARRFDDVADEEIALERGEIDVAVFWPGELSARLRSDPRWAGFSLATRRRGMAAVEWTGVGDPDPGLQTAAGGVFLALNRDAFRGDLGPASPWSADIDSLPGDTGGLSSVRFEVDPRCPGRVELQRVLDRAAPGRGSTSPSRHARLFYLDGPLTPETVRGPGGGRVIPLFTIRCPVLYGPELRAYVNALSSDSLVDLIDCHVSEGER
jgi:hypothetical protein